MFRESGRDSGAGGRRVFLSVSGLSAPHCPDTDSTTDAVTDTDQDSDTVVPAAAHRTSG